MENNTFIILASIGLFIILLVVIVYLRYKIGNKFEIKNPDIMLALLPIVIWLLLSGKITSLQVGDLKFETAFKKAKNEYIIKQVYQIPITTIKGEDKGGLGQIERILQTKPLALNFVLGKESYVPEIVSEYLLRLSNSTVKYIVFEKKSREFIGIITLSELNNQIFDTENVAHITAYDLVQWLSSGDTEKINSIKGILTVTTSINERTTKQEALDAMENINSDILPVVNDDKQLQGIVERSRLTASLLLDVSKSLDE